MSNLFTCTEIAERYRVKTLTVWDWIRKGKMPAKKFGKQYLISEDDIKSFEKNA
jgi:excisionase family DNA binding protein